jgi:hypothetical protein
MNFLSLEPKYIRQRYLRNKPPTNEPEQVIPSVGYKCKISRG